MNRKNVITMLRRKALIRQYKKDLNFLKTTASADLTENEFQALLEQSYKKLQRSKDTAKIQCRTVSVVALALLIFTVLLYLLLNFHTPTSSIVLRNVQGLTYPALKIVRSLSVPIITLFPSLTSKLLFSFMNYKLLMCVFFKTGMMKVV